MLSKLDCEISDLWDISCIWYTREKEIDLTRFYDKTPTLTDNTKSNTKSHQNNSKKQRDNTKTPPKTSNTQRFRFDIGRSVGVTTATQMV